MRSKTAGQAKEFIERTTRQELVERPLLIDGKFNLKKEQKEYYRHEVVANAMLKIINTVPGLSALNRRVMSMKIINPGISDMQVALTFGIKEQDVKRFEEHGKLVCAQFLKRCTVAEAQGKFNGDTELTNELKNLSKQGNPLQMAP